MAIITLTTDFGDQDGFVGIMKGVIFKINPSVSIIDIAHHIPSGDIDAAAFVISHACSYFPQDSIHVVVVDPGVGSARRALAVETGVGSFVVPDNGILKYIFAKSDSLSVYALDKAKYFLHPTSQTFHGRDVFAPVAAHLSQGTFAKQMGSKIDDYDRGKIPGIKKSNAGITGEIIYIDHFGNLVSNIPADDVSRIEVKEIQIGAQKIQKLSSSYQEQAPGQVLAIIGSHGFLEIAVNAGHASQVLEVKKGDPIVIRTLPG
jgi:S-adenosyl-L-methionine hydrolase (adenosine-forming)